MAAAICFCATSSGDVVCPCPLWFGEPHSYPIITIPAPHRARSAQLWFVRRVRDMKEQEKSTCVVGEGELKRMSPPKLVHGASCGGAHALRGQLVERKIPVWIDTVLLTLVGVVPSSVRRRHDPDRARLHQPVIVWVHRIRVGRMWRGAWPAMDCVWQGRRGSFRGGARPVPRWWWARCARCRGGTR